jgi:hypothetical protein
MGAEVKPEDYAKKLDESMADAKRFVDAVEDDGEFCCVCKKHIDQGQNYFYGHEPGIFWHFGCLDVMRDGGKVVGFGRKFLGFIKIDKPMYHGKFTTKSEGQ